MHRPRKQATMVWHNPEITGRGRDSAPAADDAGPKADDKRAPGRIVARKGPETDPQVLERRRLLDRLLAAAGRPAVTKAADELLKGGFAFPADQDVYLQLLEHTNEDQVRDAIEHLATLLIDEAPKRKAVLESRLRRIEQFADDASTRAAAERLRRHVGGSIVGST